MLILKKYTVSFSRKQISALSKELLQDYEQRLVQFLLNWYDESEEILVKTSGTTGEPKVITFTKRQFEESAKRSIKFLNLQKGETALLSLSTDYIAGKLMVIRAIVGELNLYLRKPESNPLLNLGEKIDFAAFVPMQIVKIINNSESWERFKKIGTVIIGGGVLEKQLEKKLSVLNQNIYHTYGMTETLTHIAMRKIAPANEESYHALPDVSFSVDERSCLKVRVPYLYDEVLLTNDLVKLHDAYSFEYVGRYDNVINSGGVKIAAELVEEKISSVIESSFYISSEKDGVLGERVILVVESDKEDTDLLEKIKPLLDKYECPKQIYYRKTFQRNPNGKIIRRKRQKTRQDDSFSSF